MRPLEVVQVVLCMSDLHRISCTEFVGLPPLIVVSAVFTAAAWLLLPFIQFVDD